MKLTEQIKDEIRSKPEVMYSLRQAFKTGTGKFASESHVYRSLQNDNPRLMELPVLAAICKGLGRDLDDVLGEKVSKLLTQ